MRCPFSRLTALLALVVLGGVTGLARPVGAQHHVLPKYLADRGAGVPASMFGTYVSRGELLLFPFFSHTSDHNREYEPAKLGTGPAGAFLGRYRNSAAQIFVAYGLTDWLALEMEASVLSATLDRSPSDPSGTSRRIAESGFADVEAHLRMRLTRETDHRPQLFGFLEVQIPAQTNKLIIGDRNWDLKPGIGMIRGFSWGTMSVRTTVEYNRDDTHWDLGESSIEYLRRLSPAWRVYAGIEGGETGGPDEWELNLGVHWSVTRFLSLKLDNGVGISAKANDWSPQIGVLFSWPN